MLELYQSTPDRAPNSTDDGYPSTTLHSNTKKRVASRERSKIGRKSSRGGAPNYELPVAEDPDDGSKWIHRDKLAQIEIREMAEMGIQGNRPSRANSRTKSAKNAKPTADGQELTPELPDEGDAVKRESVRLQQVVDEGAQESSMRDDADLPSSHMSQRSEERVPASRPGTSRIPVLSTSRDDDMALEMRKRNENLNAQRQRTRSRSGGSQYVLDGANGTSAPTSPVQSSPSKQRTSSKGTTATPRRPSGNRNASGPNSRSRANSTTDSPRRPGTSSGPRPPTARPEGEAPWIATMYKPDPLLPPEQQMLPTHAKRLAQMQAESEAKAAHENETSEFTLVESEDDKENRRPTNNDEGKDYQGTGLLNENRISIQQKRGSTNNKRDSGQWPLRAANQPGSEKGPSPRTSPRPEGDHGSYTLMPPLPSHSEPEKGLSAQSPLPRRSRASYGDLSEEEQRLNQSQAPAQLPITYPPKERIDPPTKEKKSCMGCCVIM